MTPQDFVSCVIVLHECCVRRRINSSVKDMYDYQLKTPILTLRDNIKNSLNVQFCQRSEDSLRL